MAAYGSPNIMAIVQATTQFMNERSLDHLWTLTMPWEDQRFPEGGPVSPDPRLDTQWDLSTPTISMIHPDTGERQYHKIWENLGVAMAHGHPLRSWVFQYEGPEHLGGEVSPSEVRFLGEAVRSQRAYRERVRHLAGRVLKLLCGFLLQPLPCYAGFSALTIGGAPMEREVQAWMADPAYRSVKNTLTMMRFWTTVVDKTGAGMPLKYALEADNALMEFAFLVSQRIPYGNTGLGVTLFSCIEGAVKHATGQTLRELGRIYEGRMVQVAFEELFECRQGMNVIFVREGLGQNYYK